MELLLADLLRKLAHKTLERNDAAKFDLASVLKPETVLVQSPGMAQWLKINIANTLQIAANIEFPLPSSYIWRLYQQEIPELPKESAFNKQHLTWKILHLLPELYETPLFEQINSYLTFGGQKPLEQDVPSLKTYHLAAKIADIYDQYLMYRPDWIEAWESGEDSVDGADVSLQPWQPQLWRHIKEYSVRLGESEWHRANMHDTLIKSLSDGKFQGPDSLFVFGMSTIPLQQIEILDALAKQTEVYIFWFNPTQHFWADVVDNRQFQRQQLSLFDTPLTKEASDMEELTYQDVGNPLLSSWGKIGRDFHRHLTDIEIQQHDLFEAPDGDSLLGWLQQEIYDLSFRGSRQPLSAEELFANDGKFPKQIIDKKDNSFEIHVTHSMLRELEILRDNICLWFQCGQVSSLSDIIVMMPDVASYAPLIDAVFSRPLAWGELNQPSMADGIPYAVSDRSQLQQDAIVESFVQLMSLHLSRMSITDVFELISVPEIGASYQLETESLNALREWCFGAGIRWGVDAKDKGRLELPKDEQNTWSFGIKRLMSGLATRQDIGANTPDDSGILPFDEVEGQLTTELGKLLAFVEDLEKLMAFCAESHTLADKINEAQVVIDCFFQADNQQEYRIQQLKEAIARLKIHESQYTGKINQDTFTAVVKEHLSQSGVGQRFLAGRLNFCTLMPMRSIPFKHVCLLGMNESDYPRQTTPISFDLMNFAKPRRGDRSRRQDDRYLFLEALLSAREMLFISYVGKSDRSNAPLEPSILVNELLQYCMQSVCFSEQRGCDYKAAETAIRQHVMTEHPLRPWDPYYFNASAPISFDLQHLKVLQPEEQSLNGSVFFTGSDASNSTDEFEGEVREIALEHLIQFYRNPVKSWFKHNWKTQFPTIDASALDEEPLALNALNNHLLTSKMLTQGDMQNAISEFFMAGQLPLGNLRLPKQAELISRVEQLRSRIADCLGTGSQKNNILLTSQWRVKGFAIAGNEVEVSGSLPITSDGDLVLYRPGKLRAIDRLSLWCHWCLYCSGDVTHNKAWFVAENKVLSLEALSMDFAQEQLQVLVNTMLMGEKSCLPFFPETAMTWYESGDMEKTQTAYEGNSFIQGEGQESHNTRAFPVLASVWEEFTQLSEHVYLPMTEREVIS